MSNKKKRARKKKEQKKMNKYSITPEQAKYYKELGEKMFNNTDFVNNKANNISQSPIEDSKLYIEEGLKSGLHPSCLSDDEKKIMIEFHGDKWFTKWGWETDIQI